MSLLARRLPEVIRKTSRSYGIWNEIDTETETHKHTRTIRIYVFKLSLWMIFDVGCC